MNTVVPDPTRVEDPDAATIVATLRSKISRRIFMILAGRGLLAASTIAALGFEEVEMSHGTPLTTIEEPRSFFDSEERLLVAAVQDHLLPSEPNSPGARDVAALAYLERVFAGAETDDTDKARIHQGCKELSERLRRMKVSNLSALGAAQREKVLRQFEKVEIGEIWLTLVLGYTLEAYVGDPAYRGTSDQSVWTWLGHQPGFPRPAPYPQTRF